MQLFTIKNEELTVVLDCVGAVLHSIQKDGVEYLWQGDANYWARRDANLFPYVGRLYEGKYLLEGKTYPMTIHGFCIGTEFAVTQQAEDAIRFTLTDNEKTFEMYPFHFAFHVEYRLEGASIIKTCLVENRDTRQMYFGIGGHPGFMVPLDQQGSFTDWKLVFEKPCQPVRMDLDQTNYLLAGTSSPFPLENGTTISLEHSLFDLDAVVLADVCRTVTLCSSKSHSTANVDPYGVRWITPL